MHASEMAGWGVPSLGNPQELYYFNRMALSVYTELGMIKELSAQAKPLGPWAFGCMDTVRMEQ